MKLLEVYTQSVPFLRLYDKLAFVLGVFIFGMFTYIMGRWPHDFFYKFYSIFVPLLCFIRFINYKTKRMHYFLFDFCYFSGAIIVIFVGLYPKNEYLYRMAYIYSNGPLGVATAAFNNALIFHKLDGLVCLVTHPVPLICMWNVRQITMHYQKGLPEDQRYFLEHPVDEEFWAKETLFKNFVVPYTYYFVWVFFYYMFNFIIKEKKIREREYFTLFVFYRTKSWAKGLLQQAGPKFAPAVFMLIHFTYFSICHWLALFTFYHELAQSFFVTLWLFICVWNGASYYVKFFEYNKLTSF